MGVLRHFLNEMPLTEEGIETILHTRVLSTTTADLNALNPRLEPSRGKPGVKSQRVRLRNYLRGSARELWAAHTAQAASLW